MYCVTGKRNGSPISAENDLQRGYKGRTMNGLASMPTSRV